MADRFYLPDSYSDAPGRTPVLEDVGSVLRIAGVVFQGMGASVVVLTPSGEFFGMNDAKISKVGLPEWGDIIRASDDPQVFVMDPSGTEKVLHRKLRHEISGFTQQKIWHRDEFKCAYCGRGLPDVQLTVDHFRPLAEIGEKAHTERNYVTACRRCNKSKGDMTARRFCDIHHYDYDRIVRYLQELPGVK